MNAASNEILVRTLPAQGTSIRRTERAQGLHLFNAFVRVDSMHVGKRNWEFII